MPKVPYLTPATRAAIMDAYTHFVEQEYIDPIHRSPDDDPDRLHLCGTYDWAILDGREVYYDIQFDINLATCAYEAYIDDTLADVQQLPSYDVIIEDLLSCPCEKFVAPYFTSGGPIPDCVKKVLEAE